MTDTKLENTSDSGDTKKNEKPATPKAKGDTPAGTPPVKKRSRRSGFVVIAILILLLIVAALAGVVWYQQRAMLERDNAMVGQAQQSAQMARSASEQAAQALSLAQQQSAQIETLQSSLADSQQHLQSLEQALQTLTDSGTEVALINDMDQLVSIAHHQLLLGGSVGNAIIALETAQARLARANRPGLAPLQQAINGDVERLRAVSTVDINRLSSRIDELGRLIEHAPLLVPDDAAPAVASSLDPAQPTTAAPARRAPNPSDSWWQQSLASVADWGQHTWWTIKQDLGSFISVRRVDDASALLLSPEQAGSLRNNLRLRLMTAQLALLMKQPDVWQTETRAVVELLQARYDINSVEGHRALRLALQLADTSIHVEMPSVANSQNAIQALREERARTEPDEPATATEAEATEAESAQEGDQPTSEDRPAEPSNSSSESEVIQPAEQSEPNGDIQPTAQTESSNESQPTNEAGSSNAGASVTTLLRLLQPEVSS